MNETPFPKVRITSSLKEALASLNLSRNLLVRIYAGLHDRLPQQAAA
jgi:hypothetical protein